MIVVTNVVSLNFVLKFYVIIKLMINNTKCGSEVLRGAFQSNDKPAFYQVFYRLGGISVGVEVYQRAYRYFLNT